MISDRLRGAWQLVEQVEEWDEGPRTFPRGERAHGLIQYSPGGWMTAILGRETVRPDRDPWSLDYALEDVLAYGGRCTVDEAGAVVHHHVAVCSYPPWVGGELQRAVEFPGQAMLQLTGLRPGGGAQRRLLWQRPAQINPAQTHDLAGAWLLEEYVAFGAEGEVEHPMGRDALGLLHYGADGWMSVIISRRDARRTQPPDSHLAAYTEFVCYYGRYAVDLDAGIVTHHTAYSPYTPMHRTGLVRKLGFPAPDVLTLTATNAAGQVIALRWRRQPAGE